MATPLNRYFSRIAGQHDLTLSAWGPYSKRYIGVSHIPDVRAGTRVDFSLMPGLYRRETSLPNVKWESGYHPWLAAPDLSFYRHRHELLWKDQFYCDIDFCRLDDQAVLAACTFVNATREPQNAVLHHFAWLNLPPVREYSDEPLRPARVELPPGAVWVGGNDYADLHIVEDFPQRTLQWDGQRPGEIRGHGFTGGFGLGKDAMRPGSRIDYRLAVPRPIRNAALLIRARMPRGGQARLKVEGLAPVSGGADMLFNGGGDFFVQRLRIGDVASGVLSLTLTARGGDALEIDGFAVCAEADADAVRWVVDPLVLAPQRLAPTRPNSLLLKYAGVEPVYGLAWDAAAGCDIREFLCDDLDCTLRHRAHDHVSAVLRGGGDGHYTNVFLRPLFLKPRSRQTLYALVCCGTEDDVRGRLDGFVADAPATRKAHAAAASRARALEALPKGKTYRFSQERMAATVLANVVYPVRTRGQWIRHNTPGRWWDCLYTWDSGFVALGLAELDPPRAIECLNAYLTEPGDPSAAFIHHGTPVPVQFYAFQELWNRAPSRELAAHFFPRLRQYHRFLAGRAGSSTTRTLKSGLLRTWDYFYNSGGWDDYPPQVAVHAQKLEACVTPVANTAHAIRTARILKDLAESLGEDAAEFDADIALFSDALQRWSWDPKDGYFSYVTHDVQGRPDGILRHPGGQNYNMGLDGASPLVTGACTLEQEQRLVHALMTPGRIWCRCGLSTVDQAAAYYRPDGYWNGAVWMPHQWFMWKALLDLGETAAAWRIAATALHVWKAEVERSYHCFEHFIVATGRGAGWHQFSGLSSPVLAWYGAYHRPGRLTTGFDAVVRSCRFLKGNRGLVATLAFRGQARHTPAVLVTLAPGRRYTAYWNRRTLRTMTRCPGLLEIRLPGGRDTGVLEVEPA